MLDSSVFWKKLHAHAKPSAGVPQPGTNTGACKGGDIPSARALGGFTRALICVGVEVAGEIKGFLSSYQVLIASVLRIRLFVIIQSRSCNVGLLLSGDTHAHSQRSFS